MKRWHVHVEETTEFTYEVEAESAEAAATVVMDTDLSGPPVNSHYIGRRMVGHEEAPIPTEENA